MNSKQQLWETFQTVSPSQIAPVRDEVSVMKYKVLEDRLREIYRQHNLEHFYEYKKGTLLQPGPEADYTQFLLHFIKLTIQCVRDEVHKTENEEEKQDLLIKVSNIESVMVDMVQLLKSFDFKLDKDLVSSIMHGYINEAVKGKFEKYETR